MTAPILYAGFSRHPAEPTGELSLLMQGGFYKWRATFQAAAKIKALLDKCNYRAVNVELDRLAELDRLRMEGDHVRA